MKLTVHDAVVDVAFNPANKNDGRPDAGMTYTASLRVDSTTGGARLTVGTDFTPPCVLAVLPEWSTDLASETLATLGFWAPARNDGWLVARPDVYAYADGVRYGDGTEEELSFMASFGFTPGARFNLALPMLRAQRAQWMSATPDGWERELVADAVVPEELGDDVPAEPGSPTALAEQAQREAEYLNVSGGGVPESVTETVARERIGTLVDKSMASAKAAPVRRRRPVKPAGKVEADVITVTNGDMAVEIPLDDEVNPFALGGV
jgi:hypothetical protein